MYLAHNGLRFVQELKAKRDRLQPYLGTDSGVQILKLRVI
jgi:hypothetical protein